MALWSCYSQMGHTLLREFSMQNSAAQKPIMVSLEPLMFLSSLCCFGHNRAVSGLLFQPFLVGLFVLNMPDVQETAVALLQMPNLHKTIGYKGPYLIKRIVCWIYAVIASRWLCEFFWTSLSPKPQKFKSTRLFIKKTNKPV